MGPRDIETFDAIRSDARAEADAIFHEAQRALLDDHDHRRPARWQLDELAAHIERGTFGTDVRDLARTVPDVPIGRELAAIAIASGVHDVSRALTGDGVTYPRPGGDHGGHYLQAALDSINRRWELPEHNGLTTDDLGTGLFADRVASAAQYRPEAQARAAQELRNERVTRTPAPAVPRARRAALWALGAAAVATTGTVAWNSYKARDAAMWRAAYADTVARWDSMVGDQGYPDPEGVIAGVREAEQALATGEYPTGMTPELAGEIRDSGRAALARSIRAFADRDLRQLLGTSVSADGRLAYEINEQILDGVARLAIAEGAPIWDARRESVQLPTTGWEGGVAQDALDTINAGLAAEGRTPLTRGELADKGLTGALELDGASAALARLDKAIRAGSPVNVAIAEDAAIEAVLATPGPLQEFITDGEGRLNDERARATLRLLAATGANPKTAVDQGFGVDVTDPTALDALRAYNAYQQSARSGGERTVRVSDLERGGLTGRGASRTAMDRGR